MEPVKDTATVRPSGEPIEALPHGVSVRRTTTHVDERGTVCELFDPRWHWHPDPLVFAYMFTLRPGKGKGKGWGLHKLHDDRYFLMSGELLLVLYDVRPASPTRGLVSKIVLSDYDRRLVNIPANVWHANWNIGSREVVVANFPTRPYDHDNPDKFRLPLDTAEIPFRFDDGPGR